MAPLPLKPSRMLRTLLVVGVIAAASGCVRGPHPDPGSPLVTNEQRIAAMLSVHAHARWPDRDFDGYPFMPLDEAVRILNRDEGRAADSRRRRAVAKLAGYAYEHEYIRDAVKALLKDRLDLLPIIEHLITNSPAAAKFLEVKLVNAIVKLTPKCPWTVPQPPIGAVKPPPPITWNFDLLVPRGIDDIAPALDPQSWDECIPFFKDTHLVKTPSCCPQTASSNCTVTGATSEPVAKPYGYTSLYEHFCDNASCSLTCPGPVKCSWDFENLLCVKTWYTPSVWLSCFASSADRYDVDYSLAQSLTGELMGNESQGIITDQGGLSARRASSAERALLPGSTWSVVHVDKTLNFANPGNTGGVGKYLEGMRDELTWLISEQACCQVEKECWISCD